MNSRPIIISQPILRCSLKKFTWSKLTEFFLSIFTIFDMGHLVREVKNEDTSLYALRMPDHHLKYYVKRMFN